MISTAYHEFQKLTRPHNSPRAKLETEDKPDFCSSLRALHGYISAKIPLSHLRITVIDPLFLHVLHPTLSTMSISLSRERSTVIPAPRVPILKKDSKYVVSHRVPCLSADAVH